MPRAGRLGLGLYLLFVVTTGRAAAQALEVDVVPMVGTNPNIPHITYADGTVATVFKAVARGGTGPYSYEWDFNANGTYDFSSTTANGDCHATFVYPALTSDREFVAVVRVTDAASDVAAASYRVRVYTAANATDEVKADKAVDDALWYLHRQLARSQVNGVKVAWLIESGAEFSRGATAVGIQVFQNKGHRLTGDAASNPYVRDVEQMHDALLSILMSTTISTQGGGDPDVNDNDVGISTLTSDSHHFYISALALIALATSDAATRTVPTGLPHAGRTYESIVQDMVDYFAWAQNEPGLGAGSGSWRYFPNSSSPDGSQNHFVATALWWAEKKGGATVPTFVRDLLETVAVPATQNPTSGGFGYGDNVNWVNVAKTGGNLSTFSFLGVAPTSPKVVAATRYIANNWSQNTDRYANIGDFYAMYSVMKGARSYDPVIDTFTTTDGNTTIDWYREYRTYLLGSQTADGAFLGNASFWPFNGSNPRITTAMGVEILQLVFLETPPVALAEASATSVPVNSDVTLSHDESYHLGVGRTLVTFEWDRDNDGTFEFVTNDLDATTTLTVGGPGTYVATLRVIDDQGAMATDSVTIVASVQNHAPLAVAVPPGASTPVGDYIFDMQDDALTLDGSASSDPDAAEGDSIVAYGWDLDGDDVFTDLTGAVVVLTPRPGAWVDGGTYTIALKVTDDGTWDPEPAHQGLSAVATATVRVVADSRPVASSQTAPVLEDGAVTITLSGTTLRGGALTATVTKLPTSGTLYQTGGAPIALNDAVTDVGLQVVYVPDLDVSGTDTFSFTVNDGVKTSAEATVTVTIDGVNDAPVLDTSGAPALTSIREDAGATNGDTVASLLGSAVSEVDPSPVYGMAVTGADDTDGTWEFSTDGGSTWTALGAVSDASARLLGAEPTDLLRFVPAADWNGTATLTFRAWDRTDGASSGTAGADASANGGDTPFSLDSETATITVTAVNDAPTLDVVADQVVAEDAPATTITLTGISAGPANEAAQQLVLAASSSDPTVVPDPTTDPATGELTFTPVANANGPVTITVTLTDDGGTADGGVDQVTRTFPITVGAVNDPPSFTKGADVSVSENLGAQTVAGWATGLLAGPPDEAGQSLTFVVTGNDNPGLFSTAPAVDAATGDLIFGAANGSYGTATITIALQDDGGGLDTSADQTFVIEVLPVNRPPAFTPGGDVTANEDAGTTTITGWASNISEGLASEAGQTLSFQVVSNSAPGLFQTGPTIDPATGDLTFRPAADANGTATVVVRLVDDGGTDHGGQDTSPDETFTIRINAVNDRPTFTAGGDVKVKHEATLQTVRWASNMRPGPSDEASQTLTFVVNATNGSLFTSSPVIDDDGELSFRTSGTAGTSRVTVTLVDSGGGQNESAPVTFSLTVEPAPSGGGGGGGCSLAGAGKPASTGATPAAVLLLVLLGLTRARAAAPRVV